MDQILTTKGPMALGRAKMKDIEKVLGWKACSGQEHGIHSPEQRAQ